MSFGSIAWGIFMIIQGISHLKKSDYFIGEDIRTFLGDEKFQSYQRGLVFPFLLLGTIMICMGMIENTLNIPTLLFLTIFLSLSLIPIILIFYNNKKFTNRYIFYKK
ncbi:hypothetical protein [uncultured Psychrobacillus sp.]|uniref:hypothetical protein n=1 Tax=uncultured Psychrobacillus sp. TaxID=1551585 RepID=UPI00260A76B4|nr:hypothetical protein [uncultured Psychrobacillus sp.]